MTHHTNVIHSAAYQHVYSTNKSHDHEHAEDQGRSILKVEQRLRIKRRILVVVS